MRGRDALTCPQIDFDGIELLCKDLSIDPNDVAIFIFAWHCNASTLGEFGWEEFRRGGEELRIDSIASFKGVLLVLFFLFVLFVSKSLLTDCPCRASGRDEGGAD